MKSSEIKSIRVKTDKEYDVLIANNLIEKSGELIAKVVAPCKVALITDDVVDALYSSTVESSLLKSGFKVYKYVFPHGEQSKNLQTYCKIINFLAQNEFTRTDIIVALGGGVTGDMAGFASATFLRGIKYVQIPTTLLAQVDSSVGGKTAVDIDAGKNLVGAFKQPSLVICDQNVLSSLSKEVFLDGMGEVAKYALLDKKVFELLEKGEYEMQELVYLCVDYKRMIVEKDEFEKGDRKLLNLGHTIAHGIERLSEYTVPHGKAVAMGLGAILSASKKHGYISRTEYEDMLAVVEKCVGKVELPFSMQKICTASLTDKKRAGEFITLITVHGVGDCRGQKIEIEKMTEFLS